MLKGAKLKCTHGKDDNYRYCKGQLSTLQCPQLYFVNCDQWGVRSPGHLVTWSVPEYPDTSGLMFPTLTHS